MNIRRSWTLAIIALALTMALGCAAPAAPPAPTPQPPSAKTPEAAKPPAPKAIQKAKVQIPTRSSTYIHFYLGQDKGIFKGEALDLELPVIKAPLAIPSLISGDVDFISVVSRPIEGAAAGFPVKLVMVSNKGAIWHIYGNADVATGSDLKGKPVAVTSIGASGHYATKLALKQLGIDPDKDVTYVSISGGAEMVAGLKAKSIGAASLTTPFDLVAKEQGFKELIFTGDVVELPSAGLGTSDKLLKEKPDMVKGMLRAMLKSMAYIKANRQEGINLLVKEFSLDQKTATATQDEWERVASFDGVVSEKAFRALMDVAKASGTIKADIPVEKALDQTLLKEVLKDLKL